MFDWFKKKVYIVGKHELIRFEERGHYTSNYGYKCKRCGERQYVNLSRAKEKFEEINCHDCNCKYCDK